MKKHNVFKVVCIAILFVVLLTWILPTSYYYDGVVDAGRIQVGLFTLINYATAIISYFGYIPLYILAVGGFYGVLYKTNGYRNLLDKIVKKYEGSEWILLTIIMIVFAVITSVAGLSMGLLFLFPFAITLVLLMGYSKMTSVMVTVGSVCIGLIGTTYSITEISAVNDVLSLSASSEIVAKIIILVIGLIILIANTLWYAKKHRIDTPRKGFLYPESTNKKAKTWPIVVAIDVVLLIMILSFVNWSDTFGITLFDDALTAIENFQVGGFELFYRLLGYPISSSEFIPSFGNWQLTDLTGLVVIGAFFVGLLSKVKFNDVLKGFGEGAKKALRPAFIATLIYMLVFLSVYHPITLTIAKPILDLTSSFNVVTTAISAFISSVLNVEFYYSVNGVYGSLVLGYITEIFTDTTVYGVIGVIWQAMYGFAMLFVPSSVILMSTLSYLNVSYFKWLKAIWKVILELLVVLLIIFLILVAII